MPVRPSAHVVLYTRRHCGLCDEAALELRALSDEFAITVTERDIDEDPDLRARYDTVIPVVAVDGIVIAHAPFAPDDLRELLIEALDDSARNPQGSV